MQVVHLCTQADINVYVRAEEVHERRVIALMMITLGLMAAAVLATVLVEHFLQLIHALLGFLTVVICALGITAPQIIHGLMKLLEHALKRIPKFLAFCRRHIGQSLLHLLHVGSAAALPATFPNALEGLLHLLKLLLHLRKLILKLLLLAHLLLHLVVFLGLLRQLLHQLHNLLNNTNNCSNTHYSSP